MKIVPYKPIDTKRYFQEITPRVAAWHIAHQQDDLFLMEPEDGDTFELVRTVDSVEVIIADGTFEEMDRIKSTKYRSHVYTIRKKL